MAVANINSYGTLKADLKKFMLADVLVIQEHRLLKHATKTHVDSTTSAESHIRKAGFQCWLPEAISTQTSSSGGVGFVW